MESLKLRTTLALAGLLLVIVWVLPNFVNVDKIWWPSKQKLNYGLDIQGGLHLVMGVDVAGVVSEGTHRLAAVLKTELDQEKIPVTDVKTDKSTEGEMTITFEPSRKEAIIKYLADKYSTTLQLVSDSSNSATYRYFDAYLTDLKSKVIHQAIETIRNRIDEFGVSEPSISQQGVDRILIQLPGMADAEKAKALINTTAKLDFMMVDESKNPAEVQQWVDEAEKAGGYNISKMKYSEYIARLNEDLKNKLPPKTIVYFEKAENAATMEAGKTPFLLKTDTGIGGDSLTDAFVSFNEYGAPIVSLRFNSMGANAFKDLTTQNRGKRMAIVLDKIVKTAPNINEPIPNGQAQITLGGGRDREKMLAEAKMISLALRAGALPAALEQLEERRVGPTLGADSIHKAVKASWLGAILIVLFMLMRYRSMGFISNLSLGLNILSVFALLTSLGATLTLPGIAGIALTVGFAVDANVLINERMREELASGSSFQLAVKEGYIRAMSAIFDANITVAATALVLLYFGTGPVRGFAVTLLIGIVTTLFANVFFSKVIVDWVVHKFGFKKLSV